jgi:hypothetical protein
MGAMRVGAVPQPVLPRDAYNYRKANEPKGIEKPLRLAQNLVSNPNDWLTYNIPTVATLGKALEAPAAQRWLLRVPAFARRALVGFANGPVGHVCQRLTQIRGYGVLTAVLFHCTAIAGLVLAPFDIKNMLNLWKDKRALLPHKVTFSIMTITGVLMSLGAAASLLLCRFGMGALGAKMFNWAMMLGGVNLIASIPEQGTEIVKGVWNFGKKLIGRFSPKPKKMT